MFSESPTSTETRYKLGSGLRGEQIYIENVIRGNPRVQKPGKTSYRTQREQIYIEKMLSEATYVYRNKVKLLQDSGGADIYRKCYQRQSTSTESR